MTARPLPASRALADAADYAATFDRPNGMALALAAHGIEALSALALAVGRQADALEAIAAALHNQTTDKS
jgi:uncharacterized membrane protein YphA (DoxX/SURF4 family)